MIRVELLKLFRRPRTWMTIALLDALPTIVAILLAITGVGPRPGQGPAFLSAVLSNGSLFAVAALAIVLPLFLPVAVAVVAGDTHRRRGPERHPALPADPAGGTDPAAGGQAGVGVRLRPGGGGGGGGHRVLRRPAAAGHPAAAAAVTSVSGTSLTSGQITVRTLIAIGYVAFSMLGVAAVALFLSTVTDSALSASMGALAILIGSSLLITLDASRALQPYLPTRYWLSFIDLFRDPILWRNVLRGVALQGVYVGVLLGAAWANFTTKDVTS